MNTSNDLVHLIASMSRQEKRYFKISASFYNKGEGNDCLRLFEVIDKLRPESDAVLAAAVKDKPYARRLSSLKNELTEVLLDSLSTYHAAKNSRAQLRRLFAHVETLYSRGLYNHCQKVLARAEKRARETEYHPALVEVFRWRRILLIRGITDSFEADIDVLYSQLDTLFAQVVNAHKYLKLMDLMQGVSARYSAQPVHSDMETLRQIVAHPLIHDETQAVSFEAQLARYNTLGTYYLLTGDQDGALQQYKKAVYLWKRFPAMMADRPFQYGRYLMNYLNCLLPTTDELEFSRMLRDLKTLYSADDKHKMPDAWNIELLYYLNRGQLEHCALVIAEIESTLLLRTPKYSPLVYGTLCYNCAVVCFLEGQYSKTMEYLSRILHERRAGGKRDLQEFARVFSCVVHYELGDVDAIDNLVRAVRRRKKQEMPLVLHDTVVQAVRALLNASSTAERRRVVQTLYETLAMLLHSCTVEIPGLPELLFWAESKLQHRSTRDVFVERMKSGPYETTQQMFPLVPAVSKTPSRRAQRDSKHCVAEL